MATKRSDKQPAEQEVDRCQWRDAAIGAHVLHALGEPGDLQRIQVRPLWQGHYRVNVFVGTDAVSVRVAHSFFLVADDDGNLLRSAPTITKQY